LASAVCLAELGHRVTGVDVDVQKVNQLQNAVSPIYEAGLDELLVRHRANGRLSFTSDYATGLSSADFIFLCVGTPPGVDGAPDLTQVRDAVAAIGPHLPAGRDVVIVNKSTLPVGSADEVRDLLHRNAPPGARFSVVSNPEFLREGMAVYDVLHPDRIVIGSDDAPAGMAVASLYAGLDCPVLMVDTRSAELIKYASNAFLATKISFANQLAELCEVVGADITVVTAGLGLDPRIGPGHLAAGLGYGGSCLPKDVEGLMHIGRAVGLEMPMLRSVQEINDRQRRRMVERLAQLLGGLRGLRLGIWGLAFKEGTDDLRDAPALEIIQLLADAGVERIQAYDPQAMGRAVPMLSRTTLCPDLYEAARDADAVILVTAWPEFLQADYSRVASVMRGTVVFDGRNALDGAALAHAGLRHHAIGIGSRRQDASMLSAVADQLAEYRDWEGPGA
jgi:UDPglucose 6-dehydrogenase